MTLNELLPAIYQLNPTEKQTLFELLDRELHAAPQTPDLSLKLENFDNEGQWLVAVFDQYLSQAEPIEISIESREPIRIDETLFGEV